MSDSQTVRLEQELPEAGTLLFSSLSGKGSSLPRVWTMLAMLVLLALAAGLFLLFDGATPGPLEVNLPWIADLGVNFHLAVDGLNVYLLLLTALLFPVVLACSWKTAQAFGCALSAFAM